MGEENAIEEGSSDFVAQFVARTAGQRDEELILYVDVVFGVLDRVNVGLMDAVLGGARSRTPCAGASQNLTFSPFGGFVVVEIAQRSETLVIRFRHEKRIAGVDFHFFNLRGTVNNVSLAMRHL